MCAKAEPEVVDVWLFVNRMRHAAAFHASLRKTVRYQEATPSSVATNSQPPLHKMVLNVLKPLKPGLKF